MVRTRLAKEERVITLRLVFPGRTDKTRKTIFVYYDPPINLSLQT